MASGVVVAALLVAHALFLPRFLLATLAQPEPVRVLLALVAIGPLARWKQLDVREMARRVRMPAVVAVAAAIGVPLLMGRWSALVALGVLLAAWIAASTLAQIRTRLGSGMPPPSYWGMHAAHLGVAVFVVGVTLVKGYEIEKDVRMAVGDTLHMAGYTVRLLDVAQVQGPNYIAQRGNFELSKNGRVLQVLNPEKRNYFSSQMPMTETAIDSGITRDVYVSLGERLDGEGATGAWSVRVYYKPFVVWIWGGALLMALGGALAAADRRYRLKKRQTIVQGVPA
jgi:cytochrome c-type biogenesis protein CcmF